MPLGRKSHASRTSGSRSGRTPSVFLSPIGRSECSAALRRAHIRHDARTARHRQLRTACGRLKDIARAPAQKGSGYMSHFNLIPIDSRRDSVESDAASAAAVLNLTVRGPLGETDVCRDGQYKFTMSHGGSGVWHITRRAGPPRDSAKFRTRSAIQRADLQALFCPQPEIA